MAPAVADRVHAPYLACLSQHGKAEEANKKNEMGMGDQRAGITDVEHSVATLTRATRRRRTVDTDLSFDALRRAAW